MAKYSRLPKKKENERVSVLQSHFCKRCCVVELVLDLFTVKRQLGHVLGDLCVVLSGSLLPWATESSGIQFLLLLHDFLERNYFLGLQTSA